MKEVEEEISKINQMNITNNLKQVSFNNNTKYKENKPNTTDKYNGNKNIH